MSTNQIWFHLFLSIVFFSEFLLLFILCDLGLGLFIFINFLFGKFQLSVLAGVAQLVEYCPVIQKGHWFDFRSGHMPGLQALCSAGFRALAEGRMQPIGVSPLHLCFSSSLPSPVIKIK